MKLLKITESQNKTLIWWYNRKSKVDWDPPYQRQGKLWSDTDKAYLIDSILNGYDIPKIYMADFTWGDSKLNQKKLPYAIIDGKQRFEAIFDFFENKITLNQDFIYLPDPSLKLGGLSYKDLKSNHSDVLDEFENYNLMVMSVYASTEEQINELFVRLNRSKPLTGAEIRNAMSGPTPKLIREIKKHDFFKNNTNFTSTRGQDLNVTAKILMFEYYKKFNDTTKKRLDKFVKDTSSGNDNKLELSTRQVFDVLNDMSMIFLPNDHLLTSAGIIPVYYWFVRNTETKSHHLIRKFIMEFESFRTENRRLVKEDPEDPKINLLFVEYDNYNRSTNNELSHKERYRILFDNFKYWIKNNRFIKK